MSPFYGRQKAQMFIVTIIFLAGLVFTVQQLLLQSAAVDAPSSFPKTDYYITESLLDSINATVQVYRQNCSILTSELNILEDFTETRSRNRGFLTELTIEVKPLGLNCDRFTSIEYVNTGIFIKGSGIESSNSFCFRYSGEMQRGICA